MTIKQLKRSTWIKIGVAAAVVILLGLSPLYADYEKPVGEESLPVEALAFLQQHFPEEKVAFAKQNNDYFVRTYEVILSGGTKLEFKRNGEWLKVEAKYRAVPEEIVPEQIAEYVQTHFPGVMVKEIAKERKEYEVELSNSLELKFDRKAFFLTDYDD